MSDCRFCAIVSGDNNAVVVHEDAETVAFLDHRPLFHGHTLLVPKLHVQVLFELPRERVEHFFLVAQRLEGAIETALDAPGSMVLINNVISQSVPHLHLHVIPRRHKDGLRFWLGPRKPYSEDAPAESFGRRIRDALAAQRDWA
jgi:histidine triad (HIT) family protein